MKFKLFLILCVALASALAFSQDSGSKEVDQALLKIEKLNILKYVTPLLLKKSQLDSLMTTIEKCQAKQKEILALDAIEFRKLQPEMDKALEDGLSQGGYPKRELQGKIIKLQEALLIRRKLAINEMVDMILETCKKVLNEGQLSAMKNLTDPNYIEGETKAVKLPGDEKTKLYIREIMLSPFTYDIFKQLAKHAQ